MKYSVIAIISLICFISADAKSWGSYDGHGHGHEVKLYDGLFEPNHFSEYGQGFGGHHGHGGASDHSYGNDGYHGSHISHGKGHITHKLSYCEKHAGFHDDYAVHGSTYSGGHGKRLGKPVETYSIGYGKGHGIPVRTYSEKHGKGYGIPVKTYSLDSSGYGQAGYGGHGGGSSYGGHSGGSSYGGGKGKSHFEVHNLGHIHGYGGGHTDGHSSHGYAEDYSPQYDDKFGGDYHSSYTGDAYGFQDYSHGGGYADSYSHW